MLISKILYYISCIFNVPVNAISNVVRIVRFPGMGPMGSPMMHSPNAMGNPMMSGGPRMGHMGPGPGPHGGPHMLNSPNGHGPGGPMHPGMTGNKITFSFKKSYQAFSHIFLCNFVIIVCDSYIYIFICIALKTPIIFTNCTHIRN